MHKILFSYILNNYLKTLVKVFLFSYSFGVILNLFEEIEFFKNIEVSFLTPLFLTILFIPGMIINLLPFIIFVASMKFLVDIRKNKDLEISERHLGLIPANEKKVANKISKKKVV